MEEYALASAKAAYEDPGEQAPMGFMVTGGGFYGGNFSHWWYQKHSSFPSQNFSDNNNWETATVKISVAEEAIIKATCRFNTPL